jgi:hypothetical protein
VKKLLSEMEKSWCSRRRKGKKKKKEEEEKERSRWATDKKIR